MNNIYTNKVLLIISVVLFVLVFSSCYRKSKPITKEQHEAFKENLVKANRGLVGIDQDKIEDYVKRRNWDMHKTETGMWYQIVGNSAGEKSEIGKIAHLKYQISLLDGQICYSSDSTGNLVFKIGHGGVESGLEEAILMMRVGDKGRFIMPPHLAYGLLGDENKIPSRTIIVYQAELLKLTNY